MSDVALLPRYPVPGYEHLTPEEAASRLHNKKNRAVNASEDVEFPPYRFMPFPTCLYRDWEPAARRLELRKLAGANAVNMSDKRQMDMLEDMMPQYQSMIIGVKDVDENGQINQRLRDANESAMRLAQGQGWATSPNDVRSTKDAMNKEIALHAAVRAYDDRNVGGKAREELDRIEDAADEHVVDVQSARQSVEQAAKPGARRKET